MLRLQEYLNKKEKNIGSKEAALESLKNNYAIKYRQHNKYPELILFKYDQLNSNMAKPLVRECRGIILNSNDWSIVARPYDKFFNLEEGHAADIDWDSARILEKLDGSLMSLYFYNGEWHCATSGTPDAFGQVHGFNFSFKELFWHAWNELGYNLPDVEDQNKTFMFELMTPYNRIVVPHKTNKLVLHGVRNIETGEEYYPESYCSKYNWECVKSFPITTKEEVLEEICKMDGMQCEGFVVVDKNFNRVKLKNLEYIKYSRMKEGLSLRSLLEIIRENEQTEFLAYFPEYTEYYNQIKVIYDEAIREAEELYLRYKDIENQKEFALAVKDSKVGWVAFSLRNKKADSCKECFKQVDIKRLEQILNIQNIQISNL